MCNSHIIPPLIQAHFSPVDKPCNDYNELRKPQVKQHMIIFVNRGVTMNLMNAFPKPFFVKDVCPGSDQNMNYMSDSIAFIYLCLFIHSFSMYSALPQSKLHAGGCAEYFQTQPLPWMSPSSIEISDLSNLMRVQGAVRQVLRKCSEVGRS